MDSRHVKVLHLTEIRLGLLPLSRALSHLALIRPIDLDKTDQQRCRLINVPLLLHVLGKCLIKIPIIWQQSNKNNTPTQKVFKIFANINVNFAGSSQVVEAIPVCLLLPPLFFSLVCVHIYIRYQGQDQRA